MCFHTSITSTSKQLESNFNAQFINDKVRSKFDSPQYHLNGFEHPNLPIITQELNQTILPAVWGIVPTHENPEELNTYFKKASKFGGGLNAKSEKLRSHFLYKNLYKTQRCLILIDAFFEPHHVNNKSFPYLIQKKDRKPFALAGIYTRFENGLITCSILTRPAMPFLANIHNAKQRQPVMLDSELEKNWLNYKLSDKDIFQIIETDYDDKDLKVYPVDKKLFSPKYNTNVKDILKPVSYPELETLF
ncbi:SOS response-associated peptidase [Flavobacteriaceae bacterium 14752]|uniref:SOS response-associated peptidase n=1 Tax=Mesohalobacter salilacus TaxID=2491711 RepID=UPI000F62F05B|nr:SOS response-associated peptidase [Flavobacteriaceae bacterium 14752]